MREFLFRGKRVDNGEWVEGSFIYGNKTDPKSSLKTIECVYICWAFYESVKCYTEVIPETVGQFTGLTDKNGKKIFEGDIVKFNHNLYKCEVIYENGTFGLASNETLEPFSCEDYGMCDNFISLWEIYWNWDDTDQTLSDVEVIGNMHDNKELLEVEK